MGEPINPEAWQWYYTVVGEKRCPVVDTFWQTETVCGFHRQLLRCPLLVRTDACCGALQGGHVLTPLPAATPLKPGSAVSN